MSKRPLRVLLVEDSEADADLVTAGLATACDVTTRRTETADGMRRLLEHHEWDVVFVSGYPDHGPTRQLFPASATLLDKPFSASELLRIVHEALFSDTRGSDL